MEKVSLPLTTGGYDKVSLDEAYLDDYQTTAYKNFTPPLTRPKSQQRYMFLRRDVSLEEVEKQSVDVDIMPGFRFIWWYSGAKVIPDNKFKDDGMTIQFVRYKLSVIALAVFRNYKQNL